MGQREVLAVYDFTVMSPISPGKISKNRLVCKNAVALAYYGVADS